MEAATNLIPKDRFIGCLLGQAVGDALGAPYEGLPADFVFWTEGSAEEILSRPLEHELRYTDDTEMMIGVAEMLIQQADIQPQPLAQRFAANYTPDRGYGPGTREILAELQSGGNWEHLAETIFPGGSFGNGAAMRAAPVGLVFQSDLENVKHQAKASALPTHRHPLGIEGAQLFAVAVALAAEGPPLDRNTFFRGLLDSCQSEEFRWQIRAARKLKPHHSFQFLGNSLPAQRSVVTAIACFATASNSFDRVIAKAISQGDDTDTLAAMAGALSGAHLGESAIPSRWLSQLEAGAKGIDYLRQLAHQLYEQYLNLTPRKASL